VDHSPTGSQICIIFTRKHLFHGQKAVNIDAKCEFHWEIHALLHDEGTIPLNSQPEPGLSLFLGIIGDFNKLNPGVMMSFWTPWLRKLTE
jgi:hypothetical protein